MTKFGEISSAGVVGVDVLTLREFTDVLAPSDGQELVWNEVTGKWDVVSDERLAETAEAFEAVYGGTVAGRVVVSLRSDDSTSADYTICYPALRDRNLVGQFAINSGVIGQSGKLTWAQIREMQSRGLEISSHSISHADPTVAADPWANFQTEVDGDRNAILAEGGFPDAFVQPGTWTGRYLFDSRAKLRSRAGRYLRERFASVQAYITEDDVAVGGGVYALPRRYRFGWTHHTGEAANLAGLQSIVANAKLYGGHLCILIHGWRIGTSGYITQADYLAFLDFLRVERDAGRLTVLNPTAALYARPGTSINLVGDPSFEASTSAAFQFWSPTSSPTVVVGGRTGLNALSVTDLARVGQRFQQATLRGVRFVGWAKRTTPGVGATARLQWEATDGVTSRFVRTVDVAVGDDWTKVETCLGGDCRATFNALTLRAATTAGVLWDDIEVTKT